MSADAESTLGQVTAKVADATSAPHHRRRLNGWHRLWIVIAGFWTILVGGFAYLDWPTTGSVGSYEVFSRMPRSTKWVLRDAGEPNFTPRTTSPSQRDETVDIAGHSVTFLAGVPEDRMNLTAKAYATALRSALDDRRKDHALQMLLAWTIPPIVLYVVGWSLAWVRRGFVNG